MDAVTPNTSVESNLKIPPTFFAGFARHGPQESSGCFYFFGIGQVPWHPWQVLHPLSCRICVAASDSRVGAWCFCEKPLRFEPLSHWQASRMQHLEETWFCLGLPGRSLSGALIRCSPFHKIIGEQTSNSNHKAWYINIHQFFPYLRI